EALRSERAVRANSFNYEWRGDLPDATLEAGACSVPGLSLEGPLARNVVLSRGGKCSLYHSPTSDFTDEEVRRVKDDLMQIYFDIMDGAALNDFMNSMRRAIPHPECVRCPDRPSCCGAVVVDEEPAFRREERWLRKEVSRMRGRVLDVGCGEQPYRDIVAELIAAEQIEYHGLDPHLESLEAIRASGMGGTLYNQGVEQFECEEGYFDYVLGLRSLNHFNDMLEAFRVIARAMRVGGQLVLCDSPPFAMLRTPNQVRFADTNAPFGHEHFRNWTSEQVVEFLKRFPFRVDVHRPVSSRSSNQWIVKLVRV
ncbi:MAG: class I SAM-dependent methyltransferase, partial [Myxococcales bacterium]|nr:class I SAM-dependent methyltransferase [Myxococcales bacterium]